MSQEDVSELSPGSPSTPMGGFRHVGRIPTRWRYTYYLTADEQRELARVATRAEPVNQVAATIAEADRRWERFLPSVAPALWIILALLVVSIVLILNGSAQVGVIGFVVSAVAVMVCGILVVSSIPGKEAMLIDTLVQGIREAARLEPRADRVATRLHRAADLFFITYAAPPRGRRGPRDYRRRHRAAAARGAAALASYVSWLDTDRPSYQELADDLRRAVLRVSAGHWREVQDLNSAMPHEVWLPNRRAAASHRVHQLMLNEHASKIIVALVALAAAIIGAAVLLIRIVAGA